MADIKTQAQSQYPDRYYAQYDPKSSQPAPVVGWYDMWSYTSLEGLPVLSDLLPLSEGFWASHLANNQTPKAVQNSKIVDYTPPKTPTPLKEQAAAALIQARTTVYNNYGILNEPTPDAWVSYLKSLMAIDSGTDTISTKLPTQPSV